MSEPSALPASARAGEKKFESSRKRFRPNPHLPAIVLDGEGTIRDITPQARRLLELRQDAPPADCFFSLVHARNIYQVMRDVADMVCYGKPQASWLMRLRTGRGRWQWFRASVSNHLNEEDHIYIVLNEI